MAPRKPIDLSEDDLPPIPRAAGQRGRPQSAGGGETNRPIPIKPKSDLSDVHSVKETVEEGDLQEILRNAPAWLVSAVFHMLLLIVLGLLAVAATKIELKDVNISYAEPDPIDAIDTSDEIGKQLDDPTVKEGDDSHNENPHDEKVFTPQDLPPVNDPLASPLAVGDLVLGPGPMSSGPKVIDGAPIGLALSGRQIGSKRVLMRKYGATPDTEKAVELGLEWLAKQQKADGLWSLAGPYPDGASSGPEAVENNAAATAMALLAFQGHGDTHRDGKYAKVVEKGWKALLQLQRKDGQFAGIMTESTHTLYTHAQCTIALCELYGMTRDSHYRSAAEKAVAYCVFAQDKKAGGWRYFAGQESDTSVTGWFVMALQSARMAGLQVPEETLKRASQYLDSAALNGGREYGYWLASQSSRAVSAEGLLCRQYLGWKQKDPRLVDGVSALNQFPISYERGGRDVYYWYYATQATHHMEGKIWQDWNDVMRKIVPANQVRNGPQTGSWNPQGDKWGSSGGRLYVTCLTIYMLEVYYRHLPIYSGYKALEGADVSAEPDDESKPSDAEKASADDATGVETLEKSPKAGSNKKGEPAKEPAT